MASRIALQPDEERRMLEVLPNLIPRDRCLVVFGLNTGFRARELGAIRVTDVWTGSSVRPEISLERRFLKGGGGRVRSRTLPLNAAAQAAIHSYLAGRTDLHEEDPLFRARRGGLGLQRWHINRIVRRGAALAGVVRLARVGSHTLRKTFARKIYAASGRDVNATRVLLGHRHLSSTQAYLESDSAELAALVLSM